jgi:hypothetical protein
LLIVRQLVSLKEQGRKIRENISKVLNTGLEETEENHPVNKVLYRTPLFLIKKT